MSNLFDTRYDVEIQAPMAGVNSSNSTISRDAETLRNLNSLDRRPEAYGGIENQLSFTMSVASACCRMSRGDLSRALAYSERPRLPTVLPFLRHRGYAASTDNLPRVAQPSIWHSIVPKAFRKDSSPRLPEKSQRSTEWNPATFFIWIFLLIGSNAIQMLTLRNEYSTFSRKADQKIALLKEVLDKIQRGENVDVERVLGTGNEEQEQEWKDVIKDIEQEDIWASKDRRREKRRLKKEEAKAQAPKDKAIQRHDETHFEEPSASPDRAKAPPKFY